MVAVRALSLMEQHQKTQATNTLMRINPYNEYLGEKAKNLFKRTEGVFPRLAAKLGHRNSSILIRLSLGLVVAFIIPTQHADAAFFVPILIWGAVAAAGWFGGKALLGAVADKLLDALVWLCSFIFTVAGIFMEGMGYLLDASITYTINSDIYKAVSAIQVGWAAVRDLSNMFFIFVLLYIAILTILGSAGSSTKRWVAHLIIAALLINFSLFITQVVVDAGNVLALGFWNKLTITVNNKAGVPVSGPSASSYFMEGFRIQTVFDPTKGGTTPENITKEKDKQMMMYLGGAAVEFVAGYVFLAGAIMMIIRSVTLMILMIASPFAFLGFALPKGGGFANQWLDKLIGATFMAPAFCFMLYIDSLIIRGTNVADGSEIMKSSGADTAKFALALQGAVSSFPIIYNFVLMIILLLASLTIAQKVSGGVGSSASGFAKKALGAGGGFVAATGAIGLRNSIGRASNSLRSNEKIQKQAQMVGLRGAMARTQLRMANVGAKASFDARNTSTMRGLGGVTGVNLGAAGGAGGFTASRQKADQDAVKRAEELFPNNPVAQQNYIRNSTRGVVGTVTETSKIFNTQSQINKAANEKFPGNTPEAIKNREEYVRNNTYGAGKSRFDEKPGEFTRKEDKVLEDAKKKLNADAKKKDAVAALKRQPVEFNALKQKVTDLEAEKTRLEAEKNKGPLREEDVNKLAQTEKDLGDTNKALKDSIEALADNLKKVGTKHFAEMDVDPSTPEGKRNRDFINSEMFNKYAPPEYAKALESNEEISRDDLKEFRESGLANGSERMKDYYKKQMRNEDSRHYEDHKEKVKEELSDLTNDTAHQNDVAEVDRFSDPTYVGPVSPAQEATKARVKARHKDLATRIGYMAPDDVAKLDQKTLESSSVISTLTPRMLQEIGKREKDYPGSFNKEFFEDIAKRIKLDPNADAKSLAYIEKVEANNSKDSPFAAKYWI